MLEESINKLVDYIESKDLKGYDPYDVLNSFFNFKLLGKWGPVLAIQFLKRNPINIRPLLGIKRDYNPKGMGLFLKAYCLLYKKTGEKKYIEKAAWIFGWLKDNYSKGYSGHAWGYNFDWASPGSYLKKYTPSVVVTSFVVDGLFEYYKVTQEQEVKEIIVSAAEYIKKDIPVIELHEGISFSYTHLSKGCCYNASLLAAEILAKSDFVQGKSENLALVNRSIDFVLSKQKETGEWWYSFSPVNNSERKQIDFHQGFILVSLFNLNGLLQVPRKDVNRSIEKGLVFYRQYQFKVNGRSFWRLPQSWPVDIHNQSQGVITFTRLKCFDKTHFEFAKQIANWTIENMQSKSGYFYYRKTPFFSNRIPYIRWSQAWMLLALTELYINEE